MVKDSLSDYVDALERLKEGKPVVVPKGTKITNDAVALEAGRGKGSIKKSRAVFSDLIEAIDEAAKAQASPETARKDQLARVKSKAEQYRTELDAALGRELCLLREIFELKKELKRLTGKNIIPLLTGANGQSVPES
ncbi:hypothetical protein PTW32_00395 [Dechloromonas agitata]|jgi:hypothetical protein|uniref:hypothetical protein n=1 Tax=Dechloromonas agitata TaxID=73030 RepID=UPI00237E5AFC|nr:hypothetical protein [Dechloromonas agitata]MDE1543864.1 hypothetical protein [Dechloromonas agitata]